MNQIRRLLLVLVGGALLSGPAIARTHALNGQVLDRNGKPVERVNVRVSPGNVEIVTDDAGRFRIDYLRDASGERIRLARRTTYTFTFFKLGFHQVETTVDYTRGELDVAAITLREDTIEVRASTDDIDPAATTARDAGAGGSYEGE
jgi:hypothetical protein